MGTISQRARDVRRYLREGIIGGLVFVSHLTDSVTAINEDPQAVQIDTVTVTGVASLPKTYTITINGIDISFLAGSGLTTDDVAAGLKAAVDAEPAVGNSCRATVASSVVTLTGVVPGLAFTLSESDAELTTASVQSAESAAAVPFGRAIVDTGFSSEGDRLGAIADTAKFSAQTATGTVSGTSSGDVVVVTVGYGGQNYVYSVPFDSDDATTAGNIRTALGGLPSGLTAGGSGADFSITADVAGDAFTVSAGSNVTFAGNVAPTAATSAASAFLGLSMAKPDQEQVATIGGENAEYPANAGMEVLRSANSMWVSNTESPASGSDVYVDLTPGSGAGMLYASAGTNRVILPQATWLKAGRTSTDGIAAVQL